MLTIQRQISLAAPKDVGYTPVPLTDVRWDDRGRAPFPAQPPGVVRFLGSAAQNSRLPAPLRPGEWSAAWSYEVNPQVPPAAVLEAGGHVLLQAGDWMLFTGEGRKTASGAMGRSALTADASAGLFYLVNQANQFEARTLAGGELQFRWPLAFGEPFSFPLMMRAERRFLIAGVEHTIFEHDPIKPTMGVVYLFEASGSETDGTKLLHSVSRSDTLIFKEPRILSAMAADRVVLAMPGCLAVVDSNLQLNGVYQTSDFEPLFLAADESAWMHLLVRQAGTRALWVISPEGRRVVNTALGSQTGDIAGPPAIGYDRRIYLWTDAAVLAFSPAGKLLWERVVPGGIAGLGITTDNKVLVGAGSALSVLDASGGVTVLHRFQGESITAPPIVAANGDLLVGTDHHLYRLRAKD